MKLFLKNRDKQDIVVIAKSAKVLTTSLPLDGTPDVTILKESGNTEDVEKIQISDPNEKQVQAFREKLLKDGPKLPEPQEEPSTPEASMVKK